jgi:hypothetical protein
MSIAEHNTGECYTKTICAIDRHSYTMLRCVVRIVLTEYYIILIIGYQRMNEYGRVYYSLSIKLA